MANGAISWASQQQKMVALSVGEAEYMELASTGQQAAWLRSFSEEIGYPIHHTRTDSTMFGQSSCDIPHSKSSSQTMNQTHRHSTSLYSRTVRK